MGELLNLQIAKNESATTRLFDSLIPGNTFMTLEYDTPKQYIKKYWDALNRANKPTLHGNIFEYII